MVDIHKHYRSVNIWTTWSRKREPNLFQAASVLFFIKYSSMLDFHNSSKTKIILIFIQAWPDDALELVANTFLEDVELSNEVRAETVTLCKRFHLDVRQLSEK